MREERLDLEPSTGCSFHEWLGIETAAVAVDALSEPIANRCDIPDGECAGLGAQLLLDLLPQLRCDQAADRVAREVSERSGCPVDVLENADARGRRSR